MLTSVLLTSVVQVEKVVDRVIRVTMELENSEKEAFITFRFTSSRTKSYWQNNWRERMNMDRIPCLSLDQRYEEKYSNRRVG
jgi:hypothetical protein